MRWYEKLSRADVLRTRALARRRIRQLEDSPPTPAKEQKIHVHQEIMDLCEEELQIRACTTAPAVKKKPDDGVGTCPAPGPGV